MILGELTLYTMLSSISILTKNAVISIGMFITI